MIIAIDGPAASGKGTLARRLAEHYGLPHLDTGLLYRAVAASLIAADRDLHDVGAAVAAARGLGLTEFDEDSLRGRQMGDAASIVAAMPEVRAALIEAQRNFARRPGGAVLDGRDIGTVICPEADAKIFVTASPETRAQRRALELAGRGEKADYAAILAEIVKRDARDSERADAPLKRRPRRRPPRHHQDERRSGVRRKPSRRRSAPPLARVSPSPGGRWDGVRTTSNAIRRPRRASRSHANCQAACAGSLTARPSSRAKPYLLSARTLTPAPFPNGRGEARALHAVSARRDIRSRVTFNCAIASSISRRWRSR